MCLSVEPNGNENWFWIWICCQGQAVTSRRRIYRRYEIIRLHALSHRCRHGNAAAAVLRDRRSEVPFSSIPWIPQIHGHISSAIVESLLTHAAFYYFAAYSMGVNLGGLGGHDPQILGRGSWTVREILLYLIMHRKYVRKWWLLKRNRKFCPEAAVNGQFCLENRNVLWNCLKNRNFSDICLGNRIFWTRVHDPLIFQTKLTPLACSIWTVRL